MASKSNKWRRIGALVLVSPFVLCSTCLAYQAIQARIWTAPWLAEIAHEQAEELAAGRPYCIVDSPLSGPGYRFIDRFDELDVRTIVCETARMHIPWDGRPFGAREIHFGLVVGDELFAWSFAEQAFYPPQFGISDRARLIERCRQRLERGGTPPGFMRSRTSPTARE